MRFVITDWGAFFSAPLIRWDRWTTLSIALLPKLLGLVEIETTVDYASRGAQGEVDHTTKLSKWGKVLFRSSEVVKLLANGTDFTLRGEQRYWPGWKVRDFGAGRGAVDDQGLRAHYLFEGLGTQVCQETQPREDGALWVIQRTAWSRAEFELRPQSLGLDIDEKRAPSTPRFE